MRRNLSFTHFPILPIDGFGVELSDETWRGHNFYVFKVEIQ